MDGVRRLGSGLEPVASRARRLRLEGGGGGGGGRCGPGRTPGRRLAGASRVRRLRTCGLGRGGRGLRSGMRDMRFCLLPGPGRRADPKHRRPAARQSHPPRRRSRRHSLLAGESVEEGGLCRFVPRDPPLPSRAVCGGGGPWRGRCELPVACRRRTCAGACAVPRAGAAAPGGRAADRPGKATCAGVIAAVLQHAMIRAGGASLRGRPFRGGFLRGSCRSVGRGSFACWSVGRRSVDRGSVGRGSVGSGSVDRGSVGCAFGSAIPRGRRPR